MKAALIYRRRAGSCQAFVSNISLNLFCLTHNRQTVQALLVGINVSSRSIRKVHSKDVALTVREVVAINSCSIIKDINMCYVQTVGLLSLHILNLYQW